MIAGEELLAQLALDGIRLVLSETGSVKAHGRKEAVQRWMPVIREHKTVIVQALAHVLGDGASVMQDLIDHDGLSIDAARSLAAITIPPRPAAAWRALIVELDRLIDVYCALSECSDATRAAIMETRLRQPLSTIPDSLDWFHNEVEQMKADRIETDREVSHG